MGALRWVSWSEPWVQKDAERIYWAEMLNIQKMRRRRKWEGTKHPKGLFGFSASTSRLGCQYKHLPPSPRPVVLMWMVTEALCKTTRSARCFLFDHRSKTRCIWKSKMQINILLDVCSLDQRTSFLRCEWSPKMTPRFGFGLQSYRLRSAAALLRALCCHAWFLWWFSPWLVVGLGPWEQS